MRCKAETHLIFRQREKGPGIRPDPFLVVEMSAWNVSNSPALTIPHVHYVNVRSQPDVVSQIPSVVVGILIHHDIVGPPVPVVAVAKIIRGNRKIEAAEPESARASSFDAKYMPFAEAAGKSSMLKGMIDMVVSVVLPRIMPNPFVAAGMDVRRFGVALFVAVGTSLFLRRAGLFWCLASLLWCLASLLLRRSGTGMRRWTVSGNVSSAYATYATTLRAAANLRRSGDCNQQEREE
jgi:hypothetical protein